MIAGGGTGKNEVRVFRFADGQLVSNMFDLPMTVLSLDTAHSSNTFAFGSSDAHLRIAEIKEKKLE